MVESGARIDDFEWQVLLVQLSWETQDMTGPD